MAYADGFFLTRRAMEWYLGQYIPSDFAGDWRAAPMRASNLSGLPPTIILTVENDVLRDEAEDFAFRLRSYGVKISLIRYPGMFHGSWGLTHLIDASMDMHIDAAGMLRHHLRGDL